jgi:serine/threonine-protein kinase HipA
VKNDPAGGRLAGSVCTDLWWLTPAYDVVAYAAYFRGRGHALAFTPGGTKRARVTPSVVREFANAVPGLTETKAQSIVRQTVKRAYDAWPGMIAASSILPEQKELLMAHFLETPAIASLKNRATKVAKGSKP